MQNIYLKDKNLRFLEDQGQIRLVPKSAISWKDTLRGKTYLPLLLKKLNTSFDFQNLTTDEKVALKNRVSKIQNQWEYKKNHSFPFRVYHFVLKKIFRLNVHSSCQNILQKLDPKDTLSSSKQNETEETNTHPSPIPTGLRQRIETAYNNDALSKAFPPENLHDTELKSALFSFGLENADQGKKISEHLEKASPSLHVDFVLHCLENGDKQFLIDIMPLWKDSKVVDQAAAKLSFKDLSDEQFEVLFSQELGGSILSKQNLSKPLHRNIDFTQMKRIENSKNLTLNLYLISQIPRNDLILEYGLEMLKTGKPLEQVDEHLIHLKLKDSYNHLSDDKFVKEAINFCEKNERWDYLLIIRYHFKKKIVTGNVFDSALRMLSKKRSVFAAILDLCDIYTRKGLVSVLPQPDVMEPIASNLKQDFQYLRDLLLNYIEKNQEKVIQSASKEEAERLADILLPKSPFEIDRTNVLAKFLQSAFASKNRELKIALLDRFSVIYDKFQTSTFFNEFAHSILKDPDLPGQQKAEMVKVLQKNKNFIIKVPSNCNAIPFLSDYDQVEILHNVFFSQIENNVTFKNNFDWVNKFNDLFKALTQIIKNNDEKAKPMAEKLSSTVLYKIYRNGNMGIYPTEEFKKTLQNELPDILKLIDVLGAHNGVEYWFSLFTTEFSSLKPKTSVIPSHMVVHLSKFPLDDFQKLVIRHFKHLDYPAINKETFQNLSKDYRKAYLNSVFNQVKDNEYKLKDVLKSYKKEGYSLKEILEHTSDELHSMITNGFTSDK